MAGVAAAIGAALIVLVLWEGFESIILPRRVTRRFRLTRVFYRTTWRMWSAAATSLFPKTFSETLLGFYGPLSIILLLGIWAVGIAVGFALMYWGIGTPLRGPDATSSILTDLYFSCTTFFTLGLGDFTPSSGPARFLTVCEGGMGFGFLALVISYLPSLNQSFARRETNISLLDSRAGTPPSAAEILIRQSYDKSMASLQELLHEWERWSAELLEGHLSYPVLAYFRSQHDNQSWLAALTAIMDTCALVMVGVEGTCARQAELTFAMARHSVVDLCLVFQREPRAPAVERLPPEELPALRLALRKAGVVLKEGDESEAKLAELRQQYEPYAFALGEYFLQPLPPWLKPQGAPDNWQVSAWEGPDRSRR